MSEHEPDERERREAEALAEALALREGASAGATDGRVPVDGEVPDDALSTAALLRYAGRDGELDPARSDAILAELLSQDSGALPGDDALAEPTPPPASHLRWLRAPALVGALAAAAAAFLMLEMSRAPSFEAPSAPSSEPAASAPAPVQARVAPSAPPVPAALLAAQADWSTPAADAEARARFEAALGSYRTGYLRAMRARYQTTQGALMRPPAGWSRRWP